MAKKIARKVWAVVTVLVLFYSTVKFFQGEADTFTIVFMFLIYALCILNIILKLVLKIMLTYRDYKTYKTLLDMYDRFKFVHKKRYKLYFVGTREQVETWSALVQKYGNIILFYGKTAISLNILSKRHIQSTEEILCNTKKLMTSDRGLD